MKRKAMFLCLAAFWLVFDGAKARGNGNLWDIMTGNPKSIAPNEASTDPLSVGERAPEGTLRTAEDKAVDLAALYRQKPTILLFYQGAWSADGNREMDEWVKLAPTLEAMGYQVAAITPDQPSQLRKSSDQHHVNFTLLSDRTLDVIRRFGLAYRADEDALKKEGVRLEDYTGNPLPVLPQPAVYGLDQKGVIRFAFLYPYESFGENPERLLSAAKDALNAGRP